MIADDVTDGVRILTNSSMWQSEEWKQATTNVLSALEISHENSVPSSFVVAWRLFRLRKRFDIVSPNGMGVATFYGLLCRLLGAAGPPQVLRMIILCAPSTPSLKWQLKLRVARFGLSKASAIIVSASGEKEIYSRELNLPKERFHFVPWHTNILNPRFEPEALYGFAAGKAIRDYGTFFDAIEKLNYKFIVVSDSASVGRANVPANVELYCDIAYEDYLGLLRKAAFVVVPLLDCRRSAGQVVILEAHAFGKPVIATRTVGTVDYVFDGKTGFLCNPGDATEMRSLITRLILEPKARERMGQEALNLIRKEHTFETHVQRVLSVIKSATQPSLKLREGTFN